VTAQRLRVAMLGTRGMPTTYGGVERAVEEISIRLASRGHDVTVYCRTPYCTTRESTWRGVKLRYLPAIDAKHLEAVSHTALAACDALVRKYDIVHYHATGPSLFAPISRLSRAAVLATVQGLDYRREKWGAGARLALKAGAWSAAHVPHRTIVVSQELRRFFSDEFGVDATYIPNGVTVANEPPPPPPFGLEPDGYLLSLARLVPEKATDTLIRAFREVRTEMPLVIAGPSSHSDDYVRSLQALARADARVQLVGPVYGREKDGLLANARAFCQPSVLEGLPIALLEAMAWSRCPIVSDLPEHLEVVGDDAGLVFPTRDEVGLRDAIQLAVDQGERAEAVGRAARARVAARYSWENIVDAHERVYAEVVRHGTMTALAGDQ
jgi:glycosyltransferase involved in cell wall biosynthesis